MTKRNQQFQTIRTEGAILPPDILRRVASLKVDGATSNAYHLPPNCKPKEAITQSWTSLLNHWKAFKEARENLPESDETATAVTNERWLLPLFKELDYGRLVTTKSPEIDERVYPIERFYNHTPIHLIGCKLQLDRRTKGARGAATAIPHSMVQEFLNRSEEHLWAFISNGLQLRILRDNVSLSRQAYIEFDLEAMMEGEVYADFALLWLLCHQSRVESDKAVDCWLEKWSQLAREQGTRMLKDLRVGVAKSIETLGRGFIGHPRNDQLREKLRTGSLSTNDFYRQLLRTVYRLLFLFVAEDRELLHPPDSSAEACSLYDTHYSTRRLRELAHKVRGSKHADLWHSLSLVFDALSRNEGCSALGLCGLGSFLWRSSSTADLLGPGAQVSEKDNGEADPALITNDDLLQAIRDLAYVEQDKILRIVDYRNLGSEELGSVYESLLELHPIMNAEAKAFELTTVAGNERKTTGSYYTHDSLVQCLLDSTLNPVIEERLKKKKSEEAEQAILDMKICDPACGSGHFLIAAAHRMARHLARVRTGETEPSPNDYQHALRDIISQCIYGVDLNPMAVELCKVSLWMEALEPGKPLSFLDHHIKCGNSLLGTTPALMDQGIPNEAFKPIEGDDKTICNDWKKQNRDERKGQETMFSLFDDGREYPWDKLGALSTAYNNIEEFSDDDITSREQKEKQYEQFVKSSSYEFGHLLADAWCSAFVIEKSKKFHYGITEKIYRETEKNPHSLAPWLKDEIQRLANQYQFFHWHLEFPSVFKVPGKNEEPDSKQTGLSNGFHCILGNPPWEKLKIMEIEFFAPLVPKIAKATTQAARKKMIKELPKTNPLIYEKWIDAQIFISGQNKLSKASGFYKYSAVGELNTYALFTELSMNLLSVSGRCGLIVKSSIATAVTYGDFFSYLTEKHLISFYDFKNWALYFPNVGFHERYALLTLAGNKAAETKMSFGFQIIYVEELKDPKKTYFLAKNQFELFSPNSGTCPLFVDSKQMKIAEKAYKTFPILVNETRKTNSWGLRYVSQFHMSQDSNKFDDIFALSDAGCSDYTGIIRTSDMDFYPLYEGKYIQRYDHRFASYKNIRFDRRYTRKAATYNPLPEEKNDPLYEIEPRYWIKGDIFQNITNKLLLKNGYNLCARLVTNVISNARSTIACISPNLPCNNLVIVISVQEDNKSEYAQKCLLLTSLMCSIPFDFLARVKMSENLLKSTLWEIASPSPDDFKEKELFKDISYLSFCLPRSFELSYTTLSLQSLAKDLDMNIAPFAWNEERRFKIRAELDAAYFYLYLGTEQEWKEKGSKELLEYFPTPREAVEYIMETFPIVKRKDIARTEIKNDSGEVTKEGRYITKDTILEIYDEMTKAIRTGQPYQTRLDPPPGPPADAKGNFIPMAEWDTANWPQHIHRPKDPRV